MVDSAGFATRVKVSMGAAAVTGRQAKTVVAKRRSASTRDIFFMAFVPFCIMRMFLVISLYL
jgi:hypothetical protein